MCIFCLAFKIGPLDSGRSNIVKIAVLALMRVEFFFTYNLEKN